MDSVLTIAPGLEQHPLAKVFPPLSPLEFDALCRDMDANGQQNAVTVTADGLLLDGQHRVKAAAYLGWTELDARQLPPDADLIAVVVGQNINRRHLTAADRGVVSDRLAEYSTQGRKSEKVQNCTISIDTASELMGVSSRTTKDVRKVRQSSQPLYEAVVAGQVSPSDAAKAVGLAEKTAASVGATVADLLEPAVAAANKPDSKATAKRTTENELKRRRSKQQREQKAERQAAAQQTAPVPTAILYRLPVAELAAVVPANSVDAIICDPPYRWQDLGVWRELAEFAVHALTPNGNLLAMTGKSYVPEVLAGLTAVPGLRYWWQIDVFMHGNAKLLVRNRNVKSGAKPVYWFRRPDADKPDGGYDVLLSDYQPKREDDWHEWGQQVGNFAELCQRFAPLAGQTVCDPFLGGGTTAIAALTNGNRFLGADAESRCVADTERRLADEMQTPYEVEVR